VTGSIFAVLFLSPLTALATAAAAVSIPVIIHLLNRRRFRVVPWAAMRFLLSAQKRTVRRIRLEQWLLLAIRMLLILLLVLAMISVMPWMETVWNRLFPGGVGPVAAKTGRTHRIVVLDGSFSMGRQHDDGTSFDRAKAMAKQIVQSSSPGDGFSLILLGSPAQPIVPGPSDNSNNVVHEIDELKLPHGNSDLPGGLALLDKMVSQPLGKYHQREVYVLTDLQLTFFQGAVLKNPNLQAPADSSARSPEADPWQRVQARAQVVFVDVAREGADNLAVTHLSLADPLALVNSLNAVRATIHNYGASERKQLRVDLLVGRAQREGGDEGFALRTMEQQLVDIAPNTATEVTFPFQFTAPGEFVVQVHIDRDALDLDNSRSLAVTVKESIPVLLVNGKPGGGLPDDAATHHLAIALNPAPNSKRDSISPFRPEVMTESEFADPSLRDREQYQCVFLCDVARLTERKIDWLDTVLKRGGGVILSLGNQVDLEAYNRLLYRNGEGFSPVMLTGIKRFEKDQVATLSADEEVFARPPLVAFRDAGDRGTLLNARFRQYIQVQVPDKSPVTRILSFLPPKGAESDVRPGSTGKTLLDPAILAWPRYRGKVVLITTTVNIDWGSWPGSPAYLPLMHELVRYASISAPPRVASVGEPLVEYLPISLSGLEGAMHTPDGRTVAVPVQGQDDVAAVRFLETSQSGIYRMTIGAGRKELLFAVNVPSSTSAGFASESDLKRVDKEEVRAAGSDGEIQVVTDPSEIRHRVRTLAPADDADAMPRSSAGPSVARVLLLILLGLLVVEMVLAWLFGSARTVAPGEALVAAPARSWLRSVFSWETLAWVPLGLVIVLAVVLLHESRTDEFLGFLPSQVRLALERQWGVSEAAPGEGTRWRLEYLPFLSGQAKADRWLAGTLFVVIGAGVVLLYWLERLASRVRVPGERNPASSSMLSLIGLRLAMFFLVLVVFLPQIRLFFEREGWPDVVLLFDTSRSCSAIDDYQDEKVKTRAEQLALDWSRLAQPQIDEANERLRQLTTERNTASSPDRQTELDRLIAEQQELLSDWKTPHRLNLAKALIAGNDNDWLTPLLHKRQVKVHIYQCSTRASSVYQLLQAGQVPDGLQAIRKLRAVGESSELGGDLRAVLSDFRGSSLGAIIMITDGVTTEGEDLVQASRYAARSDVPLFFVGLGDAHEPRDLYLHDLQAEDAVNVRDRLIFDVRVSVKGNLKLSSVPVTLSEKKANDQMVELAHETVQLDPTKPVKVRLVTTPTEAGEKTYVITVPEQEGEVDKANNKLEKQIHVAEAKPIRVLYIEGYPRYEFRFIKTLLEREAATKQGIKSITLKVLLLDADREYAEQDKTALGEFPAKEELFAFDAVILGDVDPKHPRLGERNLQLLRDFVREKGGGMLFIAGEQYAPQAFKDTPLADILPVTWSAGDLLPPQEQAILEAGLHDGYRPHLTPIGQQHPIFRLATEDAQNAQIWSQLPALYWAASGYRAKLAAEVLAVHPSLPARRGAGSDEPQLHPLAIQQFVGAGRVMFLGFDETWRWRFRENEARFNQFWLQMVRYLARTRLGRVDLHLDKQTPYRRNEPIRVTVRFPDDAPPPSAETSIKVIVERSKLRRNGDASPPQLLETQTLQLAKVKGSRATYEALLTRTPEGEYKFWLASPKADGTRPLVDSRVLPPPGEMDLLRMNRTEMEQAAREAHGKFYTLAEADSLLDDLPSGTRVALNQPRPPWLLWNQPGLFLLAISLLTGEWILRKRRRLL
jgi:hypothetical protein